MAWKRQKTSLLYQVCPLVVNWPHDSATAEPMTSQDRTATADELVRFQQRNKYHMHLFFRHQLILEFPCHLNLLIID